MTDLKTCPFCGGEARFHPYSAGARLAAAREGMQLVAMVECSSCGAMTSFDDGAIPTEDRARSLWNRRAERTCRVEVERRKLSQTQTTVVKSCSECGFEFGIEKESTFPFEVTLNVVVPPNFCPNCGAKVVER